MTHIQIQFRLFLIAVTICSNICDAKSLVTFDNLPFLNKIKATISKGNVYSRSSIKGEKSDKKGAWQSMDFKIGGLHKRNCRTALRKISRYEDYPKFIGIIKKGHYEPKTEMLYLLLTTPILPISMRMYFKMERITKPGIYNFQFNKGFLKGLKGEIHVSEYKSRCLFYAKAHWKGKHSGYPNFLLSIFSKTASKMAMERLFQVSSTY